MAAQVSMNLCSYLKLILKYFWFFIMLPINCQNIFKVALKRQQAAEDAIALGIRVMATGEHYPYLPQVRLNMISFISLKT